MIPAVSLEKGSDHLIVTLYTLAIYPSVHNLLIRTFFEARPLFLKMVHQNELRIHILLILTLLLLSLKFNNTS